MKLDGAYIKDNKPAVNLVRFGDVSPNLLNAIELSFKGFFNSLQDELDVKPEINCFNRVDPIIKTDDEARLIFEKDLRLVPGKIVVGVTNQGIYDIDRYIFGLGWYGRGILSTHRFIKTNKRPQKIRERLAKEVIKILSLAIGTHHCSTQNCIITYHFSVTDLDTNTGVCDNCRENMIKNINRMLKD